MILALRTISVVCVVYAGEGGVTARVDVNFSPESVDVHGAMERMLDIKI
jgi:hypothetical protein